MGNFTNVTEIPGQGASKDQLSYMMTRYHLAKQYAKGKDVLEIACGSGTGLGYMAEEATSMMGGDIDSTLVDIAVKSYEDNPKVTVQKIDAQALPYADKSYDIVLLFEALYYIPDVNKFIAEVKRVIRPGGLLIITSVNCQWHGFNKSPFSHKYYNAEELLAMFNGQSKSELQMGFHDLPAGNNAIVSFVRQTAVKFGLIPKTMKSKELLKRIFYGKLIPIPKVIYDGLGKIEALVPFASNKEEVENYKFLYLLVHFE
jgi:SAM-dependent methyltransferase